VRAIDAQALYANRDYSPYARRRDEQVGQVVPLRGGCVLKADGNLATK
jgi:hypothetical protein